MADIKLLKISYERIVEYKSVKLTDENYVSLGYSKDEEGYYKLDSETGEKEYFEYGDEPVGKTFTHILPNPSKFSITYSAVDKEGSGRNYSGLMQRERLYVIS